MMDFAPSAEQIARVFSQATGPAVLTALKRRG
jgi:hypothetical protein